MLQVRVYIKRLKGKEGWFTPASSGEFSRALRVSVVIILLLLPRRHGEHGDLLAK